MFEEKTSESPALTIRQKRRLFYKLSGEFREYKNAKKSYIATTRFNNATWMENANYRVDHKLKCVYGSPQTHTFTNNGKHIALCIGNEQRRKSDNGNRYY